jgi:hypothetical protein
LRFLDENSRRVNRSLQFQELREAFDQEAEKTNKDPLLITMAVPASLEYAGKGFDIAALDQGPIS